MLSTAAELYPGVVGVEEPDPDVAALKGDVRMARVLFRAVRARQRVPQGSRTLAVGSQRLQLTPGDVAGARARARRSRKPHNQARDGFLRDLLALLAGRLATAIGTTLTDDNRDDLQEELRGLGGRPARAEPGLDAADPRAGAHRAVRRPGPAGRRGRRGPRPPRARTCCAANRGAAWTVADVPLLDELAELLGEVASSDRAAEAAARAQRAEDLANAQAALRNVDTLIRPSAEQLAERFAQSDPTMTIAERAESDRTWAYGHLVVDEAQELSPMTWRVLMRRCPSRSMTLVGDVAQVGSAAGASSWGEVLEPYVPGPLADRAAHRQLPHSRAGDAAGQRHARRRRRPRTDAAVGARGRVEAGGPGDPARRPGRCAGGGAGRARAAGRGPAGGRHRARCCREPAAAAGRRTPRWHRR